MPTSIGFACRAPAGDRQGQTAMLAASIRAFGGRLADSPMWAVVPGAAPTLSERLRRDLADLRVSLVSFGIDVQSAHFPSAPKVFAAAAAESIAQGHVNVLVWMDSDSIVIGEPAALLLARHHDLGYRPVDHRLIGSIYDLPIDAFWTIVFEACGVKLHDLFPVTTTVDQVRIRPYFNAGLLAVRPERGLLRAWRDTFSWLMNQSAFDAFYQESILYRYFLHQAALAGTILSELGEGALRQLPPQYAYPLHMHSQQPEEMRASTLNDVTTCRYDEFFDELGWRGSLRVREPLRGWLDTAVHEFLRSGERHSGKARRP